MQPACDIACSLAVNYSSLQHGASSAWEQARDLIRWHSARKSQTGDRAHKALALTLIWQKTAGVDTTVRYNNVALAKSQTAELPA